MRKISGSLNLEFNIFMLIQFFFHLSTVHRRRKNIILGVHDSVGNWTFDPNSLILSRPIFIIFTQLIFFLA